MARISRKRKKLESEITATNTILPEEPEKYRTALYARLSVEQDDNDTIQNQIAYLMGYLNEHADLKLHRVYEDNGFTGTNFDRPGFQEMMSAIRCGQVDCIVIKDLSRLGRNFVETGYLVEMLLPKLNVRLISINDRYDSAKYSDQADISVPVRNMVNEMYAKDVSKKICASNEARRRSGNYTIEKCIYGYQIDKENNRFLLNPETAPVVRLIFGWFFEGKKTSEIARNLNLLGVETPQTYKYRYEFDMPLEQEQFWDSGKVRKLLLQEAYSGDRFLGTRRNRLYKNQHKQERMPRDKWTIYTDDHPAIVSRDEMEKAITMIKEQRDSLRLAKERTGKIKQNRTGLFSNMVFCKRCGYLMYHQNLKYPDGRIKPEGGMYECTGRPALENRVGCGLRIKDGYLQSLVAGQVRLMINTIVDRDALVRKVQSSGDKDPIYRLNRSIGNLRQQIQECNDRTLRLYEDLTEGLIDQQDFTDMRKQYQQEMSVLKESLQKSEESLRKKQKEYEQFQDLVKDLKPYVEDITLTRDLVKDLIDRIYIDENLNIEIQFKFKDVYEDILAESEDGDDE